MTTPAVNSYIGRPVGKLARLHINRSAENQIKAANKLKSLSSVLATIYQLTDIVEIQPKDIKSSYDDVCSLWRFYDKEMKKLYDEVLEQAITTNISSSTMAYELLVIWNKLFYATKRAVCMMLSLFHLEYKEDKKDKDGNSITNIAGLGRRNKEFTELLDLTGQRITKCKLNNSLFEYVYNLYYQFITYKYENYEQSEMLKDNLSMIKLCNLWDDWMEFLFSSNNYQLKKTFQDLSLDDTINLLDVICTKYKILLELTMSFKLKLEKIPNNYDNSDNNSFKEESIIDDLFTEIDRKKINEQFYNCVIVNIIYKYGDNIYENSLYDTMKYIYNISFNKDHIVNLFDRFVGKQINKLAYADPSATSETKDDNTSDDQVITALINTFKQSNKFCTISFVGDVLVQKIFISKFKTYTNSVPKIEDKIATYIDKLIRNAVTQDTPDLDVKFTDIIDIFNLLSEKDMGLNYLALKLQKRLMSYDDKADLSIEQQFISGLKLKFGYSFPLRLENMVKDMILSDKANDDLKTYISANDKSIMANIHIIDDDLNVTSNTNLHLIRLNILSVNNWPISSYTGVPINVPADLNKLIQMYIRNYNAMTNGKQLSFQYFYGNAIMYFNPCGSSSKHYEVTVTTFQMLILLMFNKQLKYTEQDIIKNLGYDDTSGECEYVISRRALQEIIMPLCTPKCQILIKNKDSDSDNTISYSLNQKFKSEKLRVKLPNIIIKEKGDNSSNSNSNSISEEDKRKIIEERKYIVRACIVRIVKTRREITLQEIIPEVIKFVKDRFEFPELPKFIETQVEALIDQENIYFNEETKKYQYDL